MKEKEYFVVMNSNATPFFSDTSNVFVEANSPEEAGYDARKKYTHPAGLYAQNVYEDANAFHKNEEPLVRWLSGKANTRVNGIKCPACGGQTELSVDNTGDKGTDDIHICKECKTEVTVDMRKYR